MVTHMRRFLRFSFAVEATAAKPNTATVSYRLNPFCIKSWIDRKGYII